MAEEKKSFIERVIAIQSELKAPKNQYNSYGKYKYRSCEDILEALKPLLKEHQLVLKFDDEIVPIGNNLFLKTIATLSDTEGNSISSVAYAGHEYSKKGMDFSQITGASSSYARKYALNGLFLTDDSKDSDATNTGQETPKKDYPKKSVTDEQTALHNARMLLKMAIERWAASTGADAEKAMQNISKRPDYKATIEFYQKAAQEFNSLVKDNQEQEQNG